MIELAKNRKILRKRLQRLFDKNSRLDNFELRCEILPHLKKIGRVAVIGGVVRDVARCGGRRFRSDLDFVVYDGAAKDLDRLMARFNGTPNRYGGYGLQFRRWRVDVWALESTWARTAGYCSVEKIEDLLSCTFFDWDAAVYDLSGERLMLLEQYLEKLGSGVMDLNLVANPNPRGSVVRALRRAVLWDVRFGSALTQFTLDALDKEPWEELVALDSAAFKTSLLMDLDVKKILIRLGQPEDTPFGPATKPVGEWERQLPLPLGTE